MLHGTGFSVLPTVPFRLGDVFEAEVAPMIHVTNRTYLENDLIHAFYVLCKFSVVYLRFIPVPAPVDQVDDEEDDHDEDDDGEGTEAAAAAACTAAAAKEEEAATAANSAASGARSRPAANSSCAE